MFRLVNTVRMQAPWLGLCRVKIMNYQPLCWTCSLPRDQDCHELWSKRRKRRGEVPLDRRIEQLSGSVMHGGASSGSGRWSADSLETAGRLGTSDLLTPPVFAMTGQQCEQFE